MKRIFAFMIVLTTICVSGLADTIDIASMTTEELYVLQDRITVELANRAAAENGESILYEDEKIKIVVADVFATDTTLYGLCSVVHLKITNKGNAELGCVPDVDIEQYQNGKLLKRAWTEYTNNFRVKLWPNKITDAYISCVLNSKTAPIRLVYKGKAELTMWIR